MKPLVIWVAIIGVVFGAFALVTTMTRSTKQVFVVVDSSFPMSVVWSQVPDALDEIDDEERAEFALATEKDLVHGWQSTLGLVGVEPFAPCNFGEIERYGEYAEADERVLVTTSSSCDTSGLTGWRIVLVGP